MKTPKQNDIETDVPEALRRFQDVRFAADPYLETKVVARWRERREGVTTSFWKRLAMASLGLSAAVLSIAAVMIFQPQRFDAFVDRPFVVRIQVSERENRAIAEARILLPEGVYFDVEQYPELKALRELTLKWKPEYGNDLFPLVLRASEEGVKTVTVRLVDAQSHMVSERKLEIRLKRSTLPTPEDV